MWRAAVAQLLCDVVTCGYLGVTQYAVGHRVLVAHHALCPFVNEFVGVHLVLVEHITVAFLKELRPLLLSVLFDELLKALGNAILLRYAGNAFGALPVAAALADAELAQRKECLARQGSNPVGVATPRVQHSMHHFLNTLACKLNKTVF